MARTTFPETKVILNSVLMWCDLTYKALHQQIGWADVNKFGVFFHGGESCVGQPNLIRDGVHFKQPAMLWLDSMIMNIISAILTTIKSSQWPEQWWLPKSLLIFGSGAWWYPWGWVSRVLLVRLIVHKIGKRGLMGILKSHQNIRFNTGAT